MLSFRKADSTLQRGQISILMMVNLVPVLMLFAFVINIGMLVHAKINLQNAADMAAFTGAASQARLMNRISHISYQMRMNYKKFLYKYYVIGNVGLRCFPGKPVPPGSTCAQGDSEDFAFHNGGVAGRSDFPSVPSVCMFLQETGNACQLPWEVGAVSRNVIGSPIPCPPGDAACSSVQEMAQRMRDIQNRTCAGLGAVNTLFALSILYNTNPDGALQSIRRLEGLSSDLGVIPANILLEQRARTLVEYVNATSQAGVDAARVAQMEQEMEQAALERTILAFRSAFGALSAGSDGETNWGTYDASSLRLTELLPRGGSGSSELLEVDAIRMPEFSIFYTYSGQDRLGGGNAASDCQSLLIDVTTPDGVLPVSLYKANARRVYYAVKLEAKARLLFNPFGNELTLTAYSAAAPFGSRIGPKFDPTTLVQPYVLNPAYNGSPNPRSNNRYSIPTLNFADGVRYSNVGLLRSFLRTLTNDASAALPTINTSRLVMGWEAAMGPDPWEIGRYNIPVHLPVVGTGGPKNRAPAASGSAAATGAGSPYADNGFNQYFDTRNSDPSARYYYHAWAPLVPVDPDRRNGRSVEEEVTRAIMTLTGTQQTTSTGDPKVELLQTLTANLSRYVGTLASNPRLTTADDTFNIVTMIDPLKRSDILPRIGSGEITKIADPERLATSWSPGEFSGSGVVKREGYSVKFVTLASIFQSATGQRLGNNSSGGITPATVTGPWDTIQTTYFDPTTAADLSKIPH